MSRFNFDGKFDGFRAFKGKGKKNNLLGFISFVDTETGLRYTDFKLFKGQKGKGVFVSGPSRSYEVDGETKYQDYVKSAWNDDEDTWDENGSAWFEELAEAALKQYEDDGGGDDEDEDEDERPAKRTSGRGPAKGKSPKKSSRKDEDEDEDDDEDEEPPRRGKKPDIFDEDEDEDEDEKPAKSKKRSKSPW